MTDHLARVLAAGCASTLAGSNGEVTEAFWRKLRALRGLCQDVVELRRGDQSGARLSMEPERLDREREKTEEEVLAQFQRWAKEPAVRDWIAEDCVSPEERARRIREIFGLPPLPSEPAETALRAEAESNPVKPELAPRVAARRHERRGHDWKKESVPAVGAICRSLGKPAGAGPAEANQARDTQPGTATSSLDPRDRAKVILGWRNFLVAQPVDISEALEGVVRPSHQPVALRRLVWNRLAPPSGRIGAGRQAWRQLLSPILVAKLYRS